MAFSKYRAAPRENPVGKGLGIDQEGVPHSLRVDFLGKEVVRARTKKNSAFRLALARLPYQPRGKSG